jgi:hypothetical protein
MLTVKNDTYLPSAPYVGLDCGKERRVGLFRYIRSDSGVPVHFLAYSKPGDCCVVDLSVCIRIILLLSTAELGTEFAVELRSGPTTELGVASQLS